MAVKKVGHLLLFFLCDTIVMLAVLKVKNEFTFNVKLFEITLKSFVRKKNKF